MLLPLMAAPSAIDTGSRQLLWLVIGAGALTVVAVVALMAHRNHHHHDVDQPAEKAPENPPQ